MPKPGMGALRDNLIPNILPETEKSALEAGYEKIKPKGCKLPSNYTVFTKFEGCYVTKTKFEGIYQITNDSRVQLGLFGGENRYTYQIGFGNDTCLVLFVNEKGITFSTTVGNDEIDL
jgi:hypothetical protein